MKKNPINKSQLKFFEKYGFLILKKVLSKKNIFIINSRLKFLEKNQKASRGTFEPGVRKSVIHSVHKDKILEHIIEKKHWFQNSVKKILKSNKIICWNAKSNLKRRWKGSVEYYHQDYIYRKILGFKSSNMINCMVFVDDHRHLNGGLWVFPGSHKKDYKHEKFLNINSLQKFFIQQNTLDKLAKKFKPIAINESKGTCLFFHSRLVHGSSHNISPYDRKILLYDVTTKKNFNDADFNRVRTYNRKIRKVFEKKELLKRLKSL